MKDVRVSVDITHTWSGDLRLSLKAPSGDEVVLRENTGEHVIDLRESYDSESHAALASLAGKELHGPWTLHIRGSGSAGHRSSQRME